ncbi:MAG: YfhO family protein [Lachnospiraceae bacterium]|nr:YfhO family protein [Lachnospiraceae bacterium]
MNTSRFQKIFHTLVYPALLALFILVCVFLILPEQSIFGSEGDWFSQHAAVAEQFRSIFYETGQIAPDISPAGGGSNIYDFSYYGLFRPDVLLSFFLPDVPMTYIISIYATVLWIAGAILFYCWLNRHLSLPFLSFLGGILYACASCFYHGHHQIMFVNYMPFLILALWGLERLLSRQKHGLLVLSLVLIYLHSYYFAPAVLAVLTFYFIHALYFSSKKEAVEKNWKYWIRFLFSIGISVGISAILLLPTGLDLLSTKKDAGTPASLTEIFSLEFSMDSLLYRPYSCGLTILCLYTLFLSIRRRSTRLLSLVLLLCLTVNTCSYLLSGLLYVRYKVLIPLVPLLLLLCAQTLEELFMGREKHSLICGCLCLIPIISSDNYGNFMWIDFILTIVSFLIIGAFKKFFIKKDFLGKTVNFEHTEFSTSIFRRKNILLPIYLLLCLAPASLSVILGQQDNFISASDTRQQVFSQKELKALNPDKRYRFDCLTEPYANANVLSFPGMGSTTMYSSVTDVNYGNFFYEVMRNPIRIRNRVALMTDANPFFSYLMGIRYIQTKDSHIPWGYEPVLQKDNILIAENKQVLPTAYVSNAQMTQKEYEKLSFPYTLEAITRYTITDFEETETISAEDFQKDSYITACTFQDLTNIKISELFADISNTVVWEEDEKGRTCSFSVKEKTKLTIPLSEPLQNKILICTFGVKSKNGSEVTIDINKIRNKLSGKNAPYPNHNDVFTYLISSYQDISKLNITLSPGKYTLSDFQFWTMDTSHWGNPGVDTDSFQYKEGSALLQGTACLEKDGCFATSFPFRKGYRVLVDGKDVPIYPVNTEFVGFPLEAGTHEIIISYTPPGKTAGLWLSSISLLLLLLGMFLENFFQKRILYSFPKNRNRKEELL